MANELTVAIGQTGLTVTALLYLNGALTNGIITCSEVANAGGLYVGSMPAVSAGLYEIMYYANGVLRASGEIDWTGLAEALVSSRLATNSYTPPDNANIAAGAASAAAAAASSAAGAASASAAAASGADIQNRIPAALVNGLMASHITELANNVITALSIAADAIAKIQANLATATNVSDLGTAIGNEFTVTNNAIAQIPTNPLLATNYTPPLSAPQTAAAVLDASAAAHNTPGTIGEKINNSGSGLTTDPLTNAPGHYSAGQIGANLDTTINSRQTLGAGGTSTIITITAGGTPLANVDIWATTDLAGGNVVARGYTNTFGNVTFMLDAGTYYVWQQLAGYSFINPQTMVVT